MVYLWKKDGAVYHHTGLTAAPDMEMGEAEFEAAGGIARIEGGGIALDRTEAEKQAGENEWQIAVLKRKLADTDYIAAKIAEGSAVPADYAEEIARRRAWRQEINGLSASA